MRIVALLLLTIFSAGAWLYAYGTVNSCQVPIYYSIGTIDEVFELSLEEAKSSASAATAIWEPLSERSLFRYDENASLKINFIFDERHARFQTKEMWQMELNRLEEAYRSLERQYESLENRYNQLVGELRAAESRYEELVSRLEQERSRRASSESSEAALESVLEQERVVNQLATQVNGTVDQMNPLVDKVNEAIATYNAEAERFNTQFGESESFTQGDFSRDTINIYTFSNTKDLTQVLAHEFGHALGLEHVDEEGAVMYYMVSDSDAPMTLRQSDKTEFLRACRADDSWQARLTLVSAPITHFINNLVYNF